MQFLTRFGTKKKPLLACEIRHSLPGRVRVGCRALKYLADEAGEIAERLTNLPEVESARISPITRNALIYFDDDRATAESIRESCESIIGGFSRVAYMAEREAQNTPTVNERRLQEAPIMEMVSRVAVITVTLALAYFRRGGSRPDSSLRGRLLTMPTLTALSLGWPIFKSGALSIKNEHRPNADTLSSAAILASLIAGSGTSALTIIWLAEIAELLTAYSMGRTRRAISEMLSLGEQHVWLLREDGTETKVPLETLQTGDRIVAQTAF